MSNTIKVKVGKRYDYLPFRWWGNDLLQVFYKNEWIFAEYTGKKDKFGDRIFCVKVQS